MTNLRSSIAFIMLFLVTLSFAQTEKDIKLKIRQIAKKQHCTMGITAIKIEDNKKISYNGKKPFFMASTTKIPVAITLLHHNDIGKKSLNSIVELKKSDLIPGSLLIRLFREDHLNISLLSLLKEMLIYSDNSATDIILQNIGGTAVVAKELKRCGFNHIIVSRTIRQMFIDANGLKKMPPKSTWCSECWSQTFNNIPVTTKINAWNNFIHSPKDTATAEDMANLLCHLQDNKLLSPKNTKLLLSIMGDCKTGENRIKGLLPADAHVVHKTGSWGFLRKTKEERFTSDVGIITLPHDKGHVAIAVYVKSAASNDISREKAIALATKVIYNYFNNTSAKIITSAN